jgi:hypothetical protein
LGVAGWDLSSEEIINLALRHQKLRGLRLRDVHLKEGSMWKDVLGSLKYSLSRLRWISLRRIGYVPTMEDMENGGAEVPDDQPWALSESETDSDDEDGAPGPSDPTRRIHREAEATNGHQSNGRLSSDEDSDSESEHEFESHATDFPNLDSPTTQTPAPYEEDIWADNQLFPDDLDDDGRSISNAKRKIWEQWVVGRRRDEMGSVVSFTPG